MDLEGESPRRAAHTVLRPLVGRARDSYTTDTGKKGDRVNHSLPSTRGSLGVTRHAPRDRRSTRDLVVVSLHLLWGAFVPVPSPTLALGPTPAGQYGWGRSVLCTSTPVRGLNNTFNPPASSPDGRSACGV